MNFSRVATERRELRQARRRGRRDGKNEVPRQDWGHGSVPYLVELSTRFAALASATVMQFEELQLRREAQKVLSQQLAFRQEAEFQHVRQQEARAFAVVEQAQATVEGTADEAPLGKFARTRLIGNFAYWPFLFFLAIGEFLITVPALKFLLGEKSGPANVVAAAVSVLSIAASHSIGVTIKTKLDRSKPQTRLVSLFLFLVVVTVVATVLYLSYVRGAKSNLVAGQLQEIGKGWRLEFLWGLYTVLQLTFVTVGSYLSFLHHSETQSALLRAKLYYVWRRRLTRWMERRSRRQGASVEEALLAIDKLVDQERVVLRSRLALLGARYREVCAVYRDANIHNRRDELDGAHQALHEPTVSFELDVHLKELGSPRSDTESIRI